MFSNEKGEIYFISFDPTVENSPNNLAISTHFLKDDLPVQEFFAVPSTNLLLVLIYTDQFDQIKLWDISNLKDDATIDTIKPSTFL